MSRAEFYDMSLSEWLAAVEGLEEALGVDRTAPATSDDFANFQEYAEPSRSA